MQVRPGGQEVTRRIESLKYSTQEGSRVNWKYWTRLERFVKDECSSLSGLVISDEEKSFITLTPAVNLLDIFHFGEQNKLACLFRAIPGTYLIFGSKGGAYPNGTPYGTQL
jgi:hypothetical protein